MISGNGLEVKVTLSGTQARPLEHDGCYSECEVIVYASAKHGRDGYMSQYTNSYYSIR